MVERIPKTVRTHESVLVSVSFFFRVIKRTDLQSTQMDSNHLEQYVRDAIRVTTLTRDVQNKVIDSDYLHSSTVLIGWQ